MSLTVIFLYTRLLQRSINSKSRHKVQQLSRYLSFSKSPIPLQVQSFSIEVNSGNSPSNHLYSL